MNHRVCSPVFSNMFDVLTAMKGKNEVERGERRVEYETRGNSRAMNSRLPAELLPALLALQIYFTFIFSFLPSEYHCFFFSNSDVFSLNSSRNFGHLLVISVFMLLSK